jgi:hypothetical protein
VGSIEESFVQVPMEASGWVLTPAQIDRLGVSRKLVRRAANESDQGTAGGRGDASAPTDDKPGFREASMGSRSQK